MTSFSLRSLGLCLALLAVASAGCTAARGRPAPAAEARAGISAPRPSLAVEGRPYWSAGFDAAYSVALRNLHLPTGFHPYRHARAAPAALGVHLWDSAFLSQIWKPWDLQVAREINLAVLHHAHEGRVPHFSHRLARSPLTQPPVIAWAIWEGFLWSGDTTYLAEVYPALAAYDAWLFRERRLPSGLFFWRAPFESGMDNSPRFDAPGGRGQRDLRTVAAVDLSAYVVLQSTLLARMAGVLGLPEERALHEARAAEVRELINTRLWDEESGYYYDRDESTDEWIRVRSAAAFLPLFAAVPDARRARRLRDQIMDPAAFNLPLPLPTVALDDPSFSRDMWRGPVWINVSYMIIGGLDAYGFSEEAADLAFRTVDGVFWTHDRTNGIWEFYDPTRFDIAALERKRGELFKQLTLGNKPLPHYGWSGLVNNLVIEQLVGYRREGERSWIAPRFPRYAAGMRLRLNLPSRDLVIRMEVLEDGGARGEVIAGTHAYAFDVARGEEVPLEAAHEEALRRGCQRCHLGTFDFQALAFYQKLGYEIFGVLEDRPPGRRRCYLQKGDLVVPAGTGRRF